MGNYKRNPYEIKRPNIPEKTYYFNQGVGPTGKVNSKGIKRRTQIADWVFESMSSEGKENIVFDLKSLINNGDLSKAHYVMAQYIENMEDPVLQYMILSNVHEFGKQVYTDLIKRLLKTRKRLRPKKEVTTTEKKEISELVDEVKRPVKARKRRFGIDKQGKRKMAKIERIRYKTGTVVLRLRDEKTGRFLKATKTFKKEVKKRQ